MKKLSLGIINLGHVAPGYTAQEEILGCLQEAALAEKYGFTRYWLAEHHSEHQAWTNPTQMLPLVGAATTRIRLGTAGILLALRSALDVAESSKFCTALLGERVELGFAAGFTEREISVEYGLDDYSKQGIDRVFNVRFERFLKILSRTFPSDHRLARGASPLSNLLPQLWIMGSSVEKVDLAARTGISFGYSIMHPRSLGTPTAIRRYRDHFSAGFQEAPYANLAVRVACGETPAEVESIRIPDALPRHQVRGRPHECFEQLSAVAEEFAVDELIVKIEGVNSADRLRRITLLGQEMSRWDCGGSRMME